MEKRVEGERSARYGISVDELMPKQVYRKLLTNPNTRFRFKFVVEVEEVWNTRKIQN